MDIDIMWNGFTKYSEMLEAMLVQWNEANSPKNVDIPMVEGTGVVGEPLNCTMGNWENMETSKTGNVAAPYAWQWLSDETVVGAGSMYVVQPTDAGHSITCVLTATNNYGSTEAEPSNATAVANGGTARHGNGRRTRHGEHGEHGEPEQPIGRPS